MDVKQTLTQIKFNIEKYGVSNTIKKCFSKVFRVFVDVNKKEKEAYLKWIENNEPKEDELEKQRKHKFKYNPKISIIVPMYKTKKEFFEELVESLIGQTYENWELALADGSEEKNPELEEIAKKDKRIIYKFLGENKNIAGNTNEALALATGDFIGLLDHDDILPKHSLYEVVKAINENPNVEFLYSDEDQIENGKRFSPYFKPDFAIDTLRANNYICHFSVFKKELMEKLGGFRDEYNGAQDFDIILRMSENVKSYENIIHIPKILYHWRMHENSTAKVVASKPYAYEAGKKAVEDHLKRLNIKARVEHSDFVLGGYNVFYDIKNKKKVSILIPNKDETEVLDKCIKSIKEKTKYENYEIVIIENNSEKQETFDYYKKIKDEKTKIVYYKEKGFNYSAIINFGVKNSDGEYILQLNNDTEVLREDWLENLVGFIQRKDIGAVGAKLYYKDKSIQHAGIALGIKGLACNLFIGLRAPTRGYFNKENLIQNLSAVTGACLMSRREIYEEVDFMEENLPVAFNDVDFCLKIREKGYLVVYNPLVELIHYESKTRGYELDEEKQKRFDKESETFKKKWKNILKKDPYYNINFTRETNQYNINTEKVN